jgi:hypothetical protein
VEFDTEPTKDALETFVNIGVDSVGAAAGGLAGLAVGGSPGAVLGGAMGAAATNTLHNLAADFLHRHLSRRERARAGTVFALTAASIRSRGDAIRDDGFFEEIDGRSSAEEAAEAVVLAAQRDPAEKKLRYYAELLASIATRPVIDDGAAHRLVSLLTELSWRQLVMLALLNCSEDDPLAIVKADFPPKQGTWIRSSAIVAELDDLFRRGLVNGSWGLSGTLFVPPDQLRTIGLSTFLIAHANLSWIGVEDRRQLRDRMLLVGRETTPFE